MRCSISDLDIYIGDDRNILVTITDEDGNVVNITDWTIYFAIKHDSSDADEDAIFSTSVTSHTNAAGGQTTITIPSATSDDFTAGVYLYGIRAKDDDDKIKTVKNGSFAIYDSIPTGTA